MFYRFLNGQIGLRLRVVVAAGLRKRIFLNQIPQRCKRGCLYSTSAEPAKQKETTEDEDEQKSWRENPHLKYWILGTLGISGTIYYYVRKNHETKRVIVKSFPPVPTHYAHPRERELSDLLSLHNQLKKGGTPTVLHIVGSPGSGKTQLARLFAEKLFKDEEKSFHFLPGNLLYGTVNASSLDSLLFDIKRFAISVGCLESDWTSKAGEGVQFSSLSKIKQLDCFVEAVREKLHNSQAWILILENLKDMDILNQWFSSDSRKNWGNGTILVTREMNARGDSLVNNTYNVDEG